MSHPSESPQPANERTLSGRALLFWTAVAGLAATLVALVVEYAAFIPIFDREPKTSVSSVAFASPDPPHPAEGRTASADAEKGGLGGNSHCRELLNGPGTVQWRSCAKVENGSIAFGVKITNIGTRPQTVFAQVEYEDATSRPTRQRCPGGGRWTITIAPGETTGSPLEECSVPLKTAHFQGMGWVVATEKEINPAAFSWATSAHVVLSAGRVHWRWEKGGVYDNIPLT
jgi:hypothetical protein